MVIMSGWMADSSTRTVCVSWKVSVFFWLNNGINVRVSWEVSAILFYIHNQLEHSFFFYQCDRIILYEDEATLSKVNNLNPNSIELSNPMQRAQFEKANKYAKQYCQSETAILGHANLFLELCKKISMR